MVDSIWPESSGGNTSLSAPNAIVARSGTRRHELSPEEAKRSVVNPIYTGAGPSPRLVEDAACAKLIEEEGPQ